MEFVETMFEAERNLNFALSEYICNKTDVLTESASDKFIELKNKIIRFIESIISGIEKLYNQAITFIKEKILKRKIDSATKKDNKGQEFEQGAKFSEQDYAAIGISHLSEANVEFKAADINNKIVGALNKMVERLYDVTLQRAKDLGNNLDTDEFFKPMNDVVQKYVGDEYAFYDENKKSIKDWRENVLAKKKDLLKIPQYTNLDYIFNEMKEFEKVDKEFKRFKTETLGSLSLIKSFIKTMTIDTENKENIIKLSNITSNKLMEVGVAHTMLLCDRVKNFLGVYNLCIKVGKDYVKEHTVQKEENKTDKED